MSLTRILKNSHITTKMKTLLSFLLAKSIWQFYDTKWMGNGWTKDNVQFMYEHRRRDAQPGVYLNEPFISANFNRNDTKDDSQYRPHKFPRIKALGILLLEIELGIVIESAYGPDCYDTDGQLSNDADLIASLRLYDQDALKDTFLNLKLVIENCLRPTIFISHRKNIDSLRDVLREHVVDKLHDLIIHTYGQPDEVKLELRPTLELTPPTVDCLEKPPIVVQVSSKGFQPQPAIR